MPKIDYSTSPDVTPRTRDILANTKLYRDGSPHWLINRGTRPAQTSDEAHDKGIDLIKRLEKSNHPGAEAVANRLASCAPKRRCLSAACPECSRAFTRWFVSSASACLDDLGGDVSILSLVHADLGVPVDQLTPDHFTAAKKKLTKTLITSGVSTFLGGLDISANEIQNDQAEDHQNQGVWQLQGWVLAPATLVTSAERKLRKLFPTSDNIPRPVKIKLWNHDHAALGYALKNTFDRRSGYLRSATLERKAHKDTRDRPLRTKQLVDLMIVLDRVGLYERLLLGGCRVVQTSGGPMIRSINGS